MFLRMIALLLPLSLLISGCSKEELKPCPAGGIGVKAPNGQACSGITNPLDPNLAACQEQVANYEDYACNEPQICPDQGANQVPGFVVKPTALGQSVAFTLTNCSTGNKELVISKVELSGDQRCSFRFNSNVDVAPLRSLKPGESTMVQAVYWPKEIGQDDGHINIYTNAQNMPTLVLPICGRAVAAPTTSADAGASAASNDAGGNAPFWRCKSPEEAGKTVLACHEPKATPDGGVK